MCKRLSPTQVTCKSNMFIESAILTRLSVQIATLWCVACMTILEIALSYPAIHSRKGCLTTYTPSLYHTGHTSFSSRITQTLSKLLRHLPGKLHILIIGRWKYYRRRRCVGYAQSMIMVPSFAPSPALRFPISIIQRHCLTQ